MGNEESFLRTKIFSFFYRFIRFIVRFSVSILQWITGRKNDLESVVEFGDRNLARTDRRFGTLAFNYIIPDGIEHDLYALHFKSPLVGASFKSEQDVLNIWLKMGLGGVTYKTVMKQEREGNARPRLQQVVVDRQPALLNSLGLPGMGIDKFVEILPKSPIWDHGRPIGISIGGEDVKDYSFNFHQLENALQDAGRINYFYEFNISCPNTDTGMTLGDDMNELEHLLNSVRPGTSVPLSVKVSPDWGDDHLNGIGEIVRSYPEIFINAGNTQFKKSGDVGLKQDALPRGGGGLSGGPLLPRTLNMIHIFKNLGVPVMATGGISTIHHVNAAKEAGAVLFGLATALIMDPYCVPRINNGLARS